jgi:hypothetical protein
MDRPNVIRYTRLETNDPLLKIMAQITKTCMNKQSKTKPQTKIRGRKIA